jgi:hypothetical protein
MDKVTMEKKQYEPPKLREWGTLAELTQTGYTLPQNADLKGGSVDFSQGA